MLEKILDRAFWDKKVPTMRDLKNLGMQTTDTRFAALPSVNRSISMWTVRQTFVETFGFAVPCRQMLEGVAALSKSIVEVGGGTGFMASQLRRFEIDVISTDICPNDGKPGPWKFSVGSHNGNAPMETLSALEAVQKYPDRDVFCSWPPMESWLTEAALAIKPGRLLFYIGEGDGGCTADDAFHELVRSPEFEEVAFIPMAQFYGINDNLMVYRRLAPTQTPLLTD